MGRSLDCKTLFWTLTAATLAGCRSTSVERPEHRVRAGGSSAATTDVVREPGVRGWLSWRGPNQHGTSTEEGLIDELTLEGEGHLWSYPLKGRGTPVVSNGRVYTLGYEGEGPDLEEVLVCLDEKTGELLWEERWSDFLSDVIYSRYALGSPTIDPETGHVFGMTAPGLLHSFTPDGELLWERSLMEDLGRLSFPNGRVGSPLVVGDLVIIHFIFAGWGSLGPARDRFFAFDKTSGDVVWASTPGGPPNDSSFSMPVVEERGGRVLLYAGLGGGHIVCVDALTGDPVWRFPLAVGGINSSALLYGDRLIAIHGKENLDSSAIGRMVSLKLDEAPDAQGVLGRGAEVWRNDLVAFTSSPVLVGNRVYLTTFSGDLSCVDADTGRVLWHEKLAPDQLHASPVHADGKLYVPMTNGSFYIIRPGDEGAEILDHDQLAGSCLGAPAIADGRIYVHTTERLYCFGDAEGSAPEWPALVGENRATGSPARLQPARLQIVPADTSVRVGEPVHYTVYRLDATGQRVDELAPDSAEVELPPIVSASALSAWQAVRPGVGMMKVRQGELDDAARIRVVPRLPFEENFDMVELTEGGGTWAWPPGHWLGGRMKWRIVEREGEKVVARNMENPLFQRTMTHFGDARDSDYTVQVDLLSDGNRRSLSSAGVVNQRYLIALKGNYQELEVSSNMERVKVAVPFQWRAGVWYRLETRVDQAPDGVTVVRARCWPRDEAEPEAWTIEAEDPHGHTHGAAGLYGFTPQSRFTVYLDNLSVTPNE